MEENFHVSVLKQEAIAHLQVAPKKKFIDATLGGGGHSLEIIRAGGEVLGIDQDRNALEYARRRLLEELPAALSINGTLIYGNFKDIVPIARLHNFDQVHGVIMDLGMSSYHIDGSKRGFTFKKDEPLDMRMDASLTKNAEYIINTSSVSQLYEIFTNFGEQQFAQELAYGIERASSIKPLKTTGQLIEVIQAITGRVPLEKRQDVLAQVFQAIRIAVNEELQAIRLGLVGAHTLLRPGGRIAVISFHSLEDRIAKLFFRNSPDVKVVTKKAIRPTDEEIYRNRRARSARLRIAEKL